MNRRSVLGAGMALAGAAAMPAATAWAAPPTRAAGIGRAGLGLMANPFYVAWSEAFAALSTAGRQSTEIERDSMPSVQIRDCSNIAAVRRSAVANPSENRE